jgi:multidrug efflux pump subunit AcrA (membrane-fusion protein)
MASITAPFDGVISARAADPGLFVASAAVVPDVNSLLTVDRTDIVTVSMSVPETYVSCLSMDTMAEIRMNALPGRVLRCPLSRIAPALNTEDRTLRVEVDLFNGTSDAYSQMKVRAESNGFADLKSRKLPFFPEGLTAGQSVGLLPGMYGTMNLVMPVASSALFVPSSAIVRDGGMTYLYENEKGVARRRSIVVQMDNGVSAAVRWSSNGTTQDLSGREEIITSNQGELEDGTAIEATLAN